MIETNNIQFNRNNTYEIIDANRIISIFDGFKHSTSKNHRGGKVEINKNVNGFTVTVYDENEILLNTAIYTHI